MLNPRVTALINSYSPAVRQKLTVLRRLIFDVASKTPGVGPLEEAFRWGQPSYLTTESKSGSLVRFDRVKSEEGLFAVYFHCQTSLVHTFKELYGKTFVYEGNRAILLSVDKKIPLKELRHCIALALTYRLTTRRLIYDGMDLRRLRGIVDNHS